MNETVNDPSHRTVAVVVAAGRGERAGGTVPKQYRRVGERTLVSHCLHAFQSHEAVDQVMFVIGAGQEALFAQAIAPFPMPATVLGGAQRRDSVGNALAAIAAQGGAARVLVHDAARPFCPPRVIDDLLAALDEHEGAIPALPVVDTLARGGDVLADTVSREGLWRIQTPQAFRFDALVAAHEAWPDGQEATDDAQMVRAAGGRVAIVEGDTMLEKLTHPADFARAERLRAVPKIRVGSGFDVHRLVDGDGVWLCGVHIPFAKALSGHSDADVALHALTDAILGAAAMGDIGLHFPPSDPQWKGAASHLFLRHAVELVAQAGLAIANADITIICEAPKVGPHRDAMQARVAELLGVDTGAVSVKATTTEKLGFTGRGEGIAAQAHVLLHGL